MDGGGARLGDGLEVGVGLEVRGALDGRVVGEADLGETGLALLHDVVREH
jgi:hypothetical protein